MPSHAQVPMVALEAELASPEGLSLAGQICDELGKARQAVERRLATGLEPSEYDLARRWCAALEAAERVVRGYAEMIERRNHAG